MHEDVGAVLHELRDDLLVLAGEVQHLLLDPTAAHQFSQFRRTSGWGWWSVTCLVETD